MKTLPFNTSHAATLGVELEFQIIDPVTYGPLSRSKELIRNIYESEFEDRIKPEIIQSMIEINTSIHHSCSELYEEFLTIRKFLLQQAKQIGVCFSGGGTHPFQRWSLLKIFPNKRYKKIASMYRYLSKRSAVFGQHVHIGCANGEDAIYLTHALARYVPHFIAISASSPFYQGIDTGFQSSRSNVFNAFPLSGVMPYVTSWKEFSAYFYKLRNLGIIESMKDFYWDIRPKPEFGTVEVRVCDTPLTFEKAVMVAAYIQTVSRYILQERPTAITRDTYCLYNYNRFQASRYGYDGVFINPFNLQQRSISEDILATMDSIEKHAKELNNQHFLSALKEDAIKKQNDAVILKSIYKEVGTLANLVHEQCLLWTGGQKYK